MIFALLQSVSLLLVESLVNFSFPKVTKEGLPWLCFREAGVRTGWRKSRLPDIYVVASEQVMEFLDESAVCQTAPILVVEVVSPDSVKRDYRYKQSEYAALEIPEYWIVDPIESKITILLLSEGLYEEKEFSGSEPIISATFPELVITVEQVLAVGNVG